MHHRPECTRPAIGPQSARVRFGPRPETGPPDGGIDPELRQPWLCWIHSPSLMYPTRAWSNLPHLLQRSKTDVPR